jgi:OFA family oxalate/formate antiporter-like MFS transporter
MVFSMALVSFTLGVLLGPMLLGRVPQHFRLPLLAGLAALSLAVAARSTGFVGFAVAYGVSFGFASGAVYNHAISMAAASAAPTLLVPVSVAAFGLGGAVFGPVQVWLTALGWGLWSSVPALACLAAVAGATLLLKPPPQSPISEPPAPVLVIKPDKRTAILWLIFAAGSCSGLIVLGFAAQILPQGPGRIGLASLAIFLTTLGNTLGRLSCAITAKILGPVRCIAGSLILSILALTGLIFTTEPDIVVALLFFVAFAYGQLAATTPLLVRSQVTGSDFSGTFGWVFTGWGVAGLVGPWTAGWLLDATGTLRTSLMACIALAALSLWLVLCFTTRDQREETR